jgi:hypothetical protein
MNKVDGSVVVDPEHEVFIW